VPAPGKAPEWQVDGLVEDHAHYTRGPRRSGRMFATSQGTVPPDLRAFATDFARAFVAT